MTGISSSCYGTGYVPPCSPEHSTAVPKVPLVAANKTAKIWGDPHIDAANGGKYSFQESGIFNVLRDNDIALNTLMTQKDKVTLDTESGLTIGDRTVHFTADGEAEVGYTDPNKKCVIRLTDGQTMNLSNKASIKRSGDSYTVNSPEYKIQVDSNKEFQGLHYMDMQVSSGSEGVESDCEAPTGLLGETFSADETEQKAPLHEAEAYKVDSLLERYCACHGIPLEIAKAIWKEVDTNGDGKLSPAEMCAAAEQLMDGTPDEQKMARLLLQMADANENGQSVFPDFNGDGGVSFKELSQLASWDNNDHSFAQTDLNKLQQFRYPSKTHAPAPASSEPTTSTPAPAACKPTTSAPAPAQAPVPAPASGGVQNQDQSFLSSILQLLKPLLQIIQQMFSSMQQGGNTAQAGAIATH